VSIEYLKRNYDRFHPRAVAAARQQQQ